jgi:aromatic-L-amino-acid decarboxylase
MMDSKAFRFYAHQLVDWMADYLEQVEKLPVKSRSEPGDILKKLPDKAPQSSENMETIFQDFLKVIMPGVTHWQSPNFFAYFPANSSYPSILAEMLTATLGAQCMKWETSPAAAELEEKVLNWLREMTGLPRYFQGVIQDSASSATLVAILSAREKFSDYQINEKGLKYAENFRVYCSAETHSSIEKAVKIAGLGSHNLVKVPVDKDFRMDVMALKNAVDSDIKMGHKPMCVVATLGTTGPTSIDPLDEIASVCSRYSLWLHVDAAFAGSALILPDYRWMIRGIDYADSFVFNPHKWLFTNFDCSAYFVKDKYALLRTLQIVPEYLKTNVQGKVNDYCDWGIPLGRRFRALKLWFVIRSYGVEGLQNKLRHHLALAEKLTTAVQADPDFEVMAPVTLNLVCFRYHPSGMDDQTILNNINELMLKSINQSGKAYLSHTRLNGNFVLRMVVAQTRVELRHVEAAWKLIRQKASQIVIEPEKPNK